jgi:hypothetical protein
MDGNFSAEHMKCRTGALEIPLLPGMAFMANPDSYQAHLRSGQEFSQVCSTVPFLIHGLALHSPAPVTHTWGLSRPILVNPN